MKSVNIQFVSVLCAVWLAAGCGSGDRAGRRRMTAIPQRKTAGLFMKMVLLPGGEFIMGSDNGLVDEAPRHRVRVGPFYMGTCEVTNRQFLQFLEDYGSDSTADHIPMVFENEQGLVIKDGIWSIGDGNEDHPAVSVTWYGAREFCRLYGYRLPTEAEWEYAARGGTEAWQGADTSGAVLSEYAWYDEDNDPFGTKPTGTKRPNPFGLYDMLGNVWEWCADRYDCTYYRKSPVDDPAGPAAGDGRVGRGGAWYNSASDVRTTIRSRYDPAGEYFCIGFRVARDAGAVNTE